LRVAPMADEGKTPPERVPFVIGARVPLMDVFALPAFLVRLAWRRCESGGLRHDACRLGLSRRRLGGFSNGVSLA
jgi:hypothetical protein